MNIILKIFFNFCISIVFVILLILIIKFAKFAQFISNKISLIWQILRISSVAYFVLFPLFFISVIVPPKSYDKNKASSPNIVLIAVDALRKDFVGSYGFPLNITPCIDSLAEAGVIFENALTCYPGSAPGHASILFGEEIDEHKVLSNTHTINEKKESIAEILKNKGYFTFGVCQNAIISRDFGFDQGFDFYWSWGKKFVSNAPFVYYFYVLPINQIIIKLLEIDLINNYSKILSRRNNQPFFGFIQYLYCHSPYKDYSRPRWITENRVRKVLDIIKSGELPNKTSWPLEKAAEITSTYAASIYYVDTLIKDLITFLNKRNLIENTLIIVTADHGENLLEHGEKFAQSHSNFFNTSLEIPMIIWSPKLIFKGIRVSGITSQAKIKAIVLDAISQESTLFSKMPDIKALVNLTCKIEHFAVGGNTFVMFNDSYKYVVNTPENEDLKRLYKWKEDFFDRNNIYNDDNEVIIDMMQKRLSAILSESDLINTMKKKTRLTRKQIRNLKALGYLK